MATSSEVRNAMATSSEDRNTMATSSEDRNPWQLALRTETPWQLALRIETPWQLALRTETAWQLAVRTETPWQMQATMTERRWKPAPRRETRAVASAEVDADAEDVLICSCYTSSPRRRFQTLGYVGKLASSADRASD